MEKIITISGKAQHGKDTTAKFIKKELESKGKRVIIISYGDYLKFIAAKYYGYKGDQFKNEHEQRHLLQYIGTEIVRKQNSNFWRDVVQNFLNVFKNEFDVAIIPDARFKNELDIVCDGTQTINLKVKRINFDNGLGNLSKHVSETSLDNIIFKYCIEAATLEELENNTKMLLFKLFNNEMN